MCDAVATVRDDERMGEQVRTAPPRPTVRTLGLFVSLPLLLVAQQSPGTGEIQFPDDDVLELTWADVDSEVKVEVCNVGAEPIGSLDARFSPIDPRIEVDVAEGVNGPLQIDAGTCVDVTIRRNAGSADTAAYAGSIVVIGPGGLARRDVTIVDGDAPAPGAPLEFRNARQPEQGATPLTWDEVFDGHEVVVCNTGTAPVEAPTAALSGFEFRALDGTAAGVSKIVTAAFVEPGDIAVDACHTVMIRSADGLSGDNPLLPGSYEGSLAVSGKEVDPIVLPLSLGGANSTKYTGVVGSLELKGHLDRGKTHLYTDTITLAYDDDLIGANGTALGPPELPNGSTIARVVSGDETAEVRVVDSDEPTNGQQDIRVEVIGPGEQGEFTGPLTFDTFAGSADVTVKVRDHWAWFVIVLVLGLGFALLVQVLNGFFRPKWTFRDQRDAVKSSYDRARGKSFGNYQSPTQEQVTKFLDENKAKSDKLRKRFLLFDSKTKDYQAITAELSNALADANLLESGFESTRLSLDSELNGFHEWLSENAPGLHPPAFVVRAGGLVNPQSPAGQNLGVLDATQRVAQMKSFSALIARWKKLYEEASRYHQWIWDLHGQQLAPIDRQALVGVAVRLLEASNEMYAAQDSDDLEQMGAARDLRRVYVSLAPLGAKYGQPRPVDTQPLSRLSHLDLKVFAIEPGATDSVTLDQATSTLWRSLGPTPAPYGTWLRGGFSPTIDKISGAVLHVGRFVGWLFVLGVGLVGAGLGSFAAINALYTDTFGDLSDYVAVFIAGASLTVLVQVVIGWAQQRRNPFATEAT